MKKRQCVKGKIRMKENGRITKLWEIVKERDRKITGGEITNRQKDRKEWQRKY